MHRKSRLAYDGYSFWDGWLNMTSMDFVALAQGTAERLRTPCLVRILLR